MEQGTVKPWELPKWAREQAARLGLTLDQAAAKALVAQVGERQQRILREFEKLALELEAGGRRSGPQADPGERAADRTARRRLRRAAPSSSPTRSWGGTPQATLAYLRLRRQGERLGGLAYLMASRLREALAVAVRLQAGESAAEVKRGLRMPARAAERFVADVARSDPGALRAALCVLADLKLDTRGGAQLRAHSARRSGLHEDTLALRAIASITG